MKSAPLRALTGTIAKTEDGEDTADAAAQAFCTTVASFRNIKESALPFAGEVVVAIVVATACCARVATSTEYEPELKQLILCWKSSLTSKNPSEEADDVAVLIITRRAFIHT